MMHRYQRKTLCGYCCLLITLFSINRADAALIGDLSLEGLCRNTKGGRWYIADDKGMVCSRDAVNYSTGCCHETASKYSCETCGDTDHCCSSYEHCVSCCMDPEHHPEALMDKTYRGLNKPETGHYTDSFSFCQNACMTTSRSTAHENAFIQERRFCFSESGRPMDDVPTPPTLPEDTILVVGSIGTSCDDVCKSQQRVCVVENFTSMNDCNVLRSHFMCEAGCGPVKNRAGQFPGYVTSRAPKPDRPAYCAYAKAGEEEDQEVPFKCSTSARGVQRLCPCKEAPIVEVEETQDTLIEGGDPQVIEMATAAINADDVEQQQVTEA